MTSTEKRNTTVVGWRVVCDQIFKWVALLGLILSLLQMAFAALGFWGAEEKPGDQSWGMAAFEPHAINGVIIIAGFGWLFGDRLRHPLRRA